MLWDFSVRTDHEIEARRPYLLIIDKSEKNCQIIDVAIPEDGRVRAKEDEKVEKYQDLAREVRKMWGVRRKVIPIVEGALGTIPLKLKENLRTRRFRDLYCWDRQGFLGKCWKCRQERKVQ